MKKLERLWLKVTYDVELLDLEVPDKVYEELITANSKLNEIRMDDDKYQEAFDWIQSNTSESACFSYEVGVEDLVVEEED